MTYDDLCQAAEARHLTVLGGFHPDQSDGAPEACKTLLLLGPSAPGFWPAFRGSAEAQDGAPDPMDRWSMRVIGAWAAQAGATALYPFGGPPWQPFFSWALRTGRIHASPVMLLVHDTAGLLVSFRGALALPQHVDLPLPPPAPCESCPDRPCRTACPVNAFDGTGYNVEACKGFLNEAPGAACMSGGCLVRRACPVSARYPRAAEHSAYHMTVFRG